MKRALVGTLTLILIAGTAPAEAATEPPWRIVQTVNTVPNADAKLRDVVATHRRAAWAVGDDGSVPLLRRFDGIRWKEVPVPLGPAYESYYTEIDATGPNDVWFFGRQNTRGLGAQWDGAQWRVHELGGHYVAGAKVFGPEDVWTGGGDTVGHYDGSRWSFRDAGINVRAVGATGRSDVWFGGDQGNAQAAVVRWDGHRLRRMSLPRLPGPATISDIAAYRPTNVWVVGAAQGRPFALNWNGRSWRTTLFSYGDALVSITADGRGGLWAADHMDAVYHYTGGQWRKGRFPHVNALFLSTGELANVPGTTRVWGVGDFSDDDPGSEGTTGVVFATDG